MNKELKISDKSPFEEIRKFDGQDGHTGLRGSCALLWGIVRT